MFPFTAIVGQLEMKLALVLNAVHPAIGGALVMGHRGTGKSTAVRALAALLPPLPAVPGCRFGCDPAAPECPECRERLGAGETLPAASRPVPVVDLPLGADVDRVTGALDVEAALVRGEKTFAPGLLARAHRGFLYIDEVNLLEDHLVDVLLDVAASGVNVVEREGMSLRHPARFVLVGSGNPEEGELRPQLLDRFGLYVRVETLRDPGARVEVVRRLRRQEADPAGFRAGFAPAEAALQARILAARGRLGQVVFPDELLWRAAALCAALELDGHRGELALARSASALAALAGRPHVTAADLRAVAPLCLRHRLRRDPLADETDTGAAVAAALDEVLPDAPGDAAPGDAAPGDAAGWAALLGAAV